MRTSSLRSSLAFSLAFAAACASTEGEVPKQGLIKSPQTKSGFVSDEQVPGLVLVEARYSPKLTPTRDYDLLDEELVVPVQLKISLPTTSTTVQDVQLSPEHMDFHLYLQDGTMLDPLAAEGIVKDEKEVSDQIVEGALSSGFLKMSGGAKQGFVYFALRPRDAYEVDGDSLIHKDKDVRREIKLSRSLLSFKLTRDGQVTPFFIGVGQ